MPVVGRGLGSVSVMVARVGGAFALPSAGPVVAGAAAGSPTAARPYGLKVPAGFDGQHRAPLVVLLHGYTSNCAAQAGYFGLMTAADKEGFLLAYPDGTPHPTGS